LEFYKYNNKKYNFAVESDGKSIFSIKLIPEKSTIYSKESPAIVKDLFNQLDEYFLAKRKDFNIDYTLKGTDFQIKVWQELLNIPFGKTISYSDLAKRINRPKAARAVGGALNKNPIPIVLACHRVVGKNGNLTGFGGGLDLKSFLLKLENVL